MITAVILCKDEEECIVDCLESLFFCSQIIVIDDNSSDRSPELAQKYNAKVFKHSLNSDFSQQRNYALTLAKNEWVLFVDADETVSKDLANEIINAVKINDKDGYFISRTDEIFGRKLKFGELSGKKFLRLGRKTHGKWQGTVHEEWKINGEIGKFKNHLLHRPHQSLSEFISEINFYTTLRSQELYRKGVSSNFISILLYAKGKFFYTYVVKLGFLDGTPGLLISLMMSFHSFLTRGKLYLLINKEK